MNSYKTIIIQAVLFFPLIALLITFPFMIINYRKYGSINKMRTIIIYSFVLYLLCAYFLVILPLPSFEYVSKLKTPSTQLILFNFINDIIKDKDLNSILQVLFNILITVPFGFYLRYYNKCSFKKTCVLTFILSLFFELTQLSGLYGIYSRSYRLFDVDDLMFNTLGGVAGYYLFSPFKNILPTRKSIDEKSFKMGKHVTGLRRLVAFTIDNIILFIFTIIYYIFLIYNYDFYNFNKVLEFILLIAFVLIVFIPIILKGSTLGKKVVRITLKDNNTNYYQLIIRSLIIYIIFYGMFLLLWILILNKVLLFFLVLFIYFIYLCVSFIMLMMNKPLWYESLTKTKNISLIK